MPFSDTFLGEISRRIVALEKVAHKATPVVSREDLLKCFRIVAERLASLEEKVSKCSCSEE